MATGSEINSSELGLRVYRDLGFWGFRVWGFERFGVWGFRVLGFRVLGFGVLRHFGFVGLGFRCFDNSKFHCDDLSAG